MCIHETIYLSITFIAHLSIQSDSSGLLQYIKRYNSNHKIITTAMDIASQTRDGCQVSQAVIRVGFLPSRLRMLDVAPSFFSVAHSS